MSRGPVKKTNEKHNNVSHESIETPKGRTRGKYMKKEMKNKVIKQEQRETMARTPYKSQSAPEGKVMCAKRRERNRCPVKNSQVAQAERKKNM